LEACVYRIGFGLLVCLFFSGAAKAECVEDVDSADTGDIDGRYEDCDQDGFRPADGDCNDFNADTNPGEAERCDDHDDNNCDGLFNEACDGALRRGTLLGGSACGQTASSVEWVLLLPLLGLRRRRP
jgi:hypothetical protein